MKAFIELLQQGGIVMYPLVLCSVVSLAIVIEKLITLRRKRVIVPEVQRVIEAISSTEDVSLAQTVCKQHQGPYAAIMQVGLHNHQMPAPVLKEEMSHQGRRQVRSLERGLGVLETVAAVSPILGLLGTVVGMIKVFKIISIQGVGEASALSGGISEALLTTAAGLTVAIPALVFYNYFSLKAENLVHEIEDHAGDLVRQLTRFHEEP